MSWPKPIVTLLRADPARKIPEKGRRSQIDSVRPSHRIQRDSWDCPDCLPVIFRASTNRLLPRSRSPPSESYVRLIIRLNCSVFLAVVAAIVCGADLIESDMEIFPS